MLKADEVTYGHPGTLHKQQLPWWNMTLPQKALMNSQFQLAQGLPQLQRRLCALHRCLPDLTVPHCILHGTQRQRCLDSEHVSSELGEAGRLALVGWQTGDWVLIMQVGQSLQRQVPQACVVLHVKSGPLLLCLLLKSGWHMEGVGWHATLNAALMAHKCTVQYAFASTFTLKAGQKLLNLMRLTKQSPTAMLITLNQDPAQAWVSCCTCFLVGSQMPVPVMPPV